MCPTTTMKLLIENDGEIKSLQLRIQELQNRIDSGLGADPRKVETIIAGLLGGSHGMGKREL